MSDQKISIPRPPEDVTPSSFFGQWLPDNINFLKDVIEQNAGELEVSLGVRVTGDGGGDWSVVIADGQVEISEGLKAGTTVTLMLSYANFVEAVSAQRDDLLPGPSWLKYGGEPEYPAEIGKQINEGMTLIKPISGTLRFTADDPKSPFVVLLKFQGAEKDEPDTSVSIDQEDLRAMGRGETDIAQAFMSGKVRIEGAMTLLMQFAPLVMQ